MRVLMMMLVPFAFSQAVAETQPAGPVAIPPPAATAPPTPTTPSPAQSQAAATAAAPVATGDGAPPAQPGRKRLTWEERFEQANLGRNGRLTLEEAKGGYRSIARNFSNIDATNKGYVTLDDIRAWRAQQKAARAGTPRPDDKLRPRPAILQSVSPDQNRLNTSTTQMVRSPGGTNAAIATTATDAPPSAAPLQARIRTGLEPDPE